MSFRVFSLFLLFLLFSHSLSAYFFKAEEFEKDGQTIVCLSDCHVALDPANHVSGAQRTDLLALGKSLDAHFIVEDPQIPTDLKASRELCVDPNADWNAIKLDQQDLDIIISDDSRTPLAALTTLCSKEKLSCTNVEFRHAKGMSLICMEISSSTVFKILNQIIAEIDAYRDHKCFNDYYHKAIQNYVELKKLCPALFDFLEQSDESIYEALREIYTGYNKDEFDQAFQPIKEYCLSHVYEKDEFLNDEFLDSFTKEDIGCAKDAADLASLMRWLITMIDKDFIDARILHDIYKNKKNIIVCAGGAHIHRVSRCLEKAGYTKKKIAYNNGLAIEIPKI